MQKLKKILYPQSVALIGASEKEGAVGSELLKRIIQFEYKGEIYPVNPKHSTLYNLKCYADITQIPHQVDLGIIAVPAKAVSAVLDQCHQANVLDIVIISSGFKEIGGEGVLLEQELKSKIERYKMNVLGPNCLGVFNADKKLTFDGCFAPIVPKTGSVGFATQSGALAAGVFSVSSTLRIGFSQMVSLGNQTDIEGLDVLEFWENDNNVSQLLLYLEGIKEPKKFREVATRIAKKKPILILKSGRSDAGAKAAASHTGSLAGSDSVVEALFASCGVVRELRLRDLFNSAQVLGNCVLPKGKRLGILTNAGGPGILATDSANDMKIEVPTFSQTLQSQLKQITLPQASCRNPVDLVASASREHYAQVAEKLLQSDEIDMLLVIYLYITEKNDIAVFSDLEALKKKYPNKPIITVYMTTPDFDQRVAQQLPDATIPIFDYVDDALRGFKLLVERKEFLTEIEQETPQYQVDKNTVQQIISVAEKEGRELLSTKESLEVFSAYGLCLPKYKSVLSLEEVLKSAEQIGYPLVLKMSSKKVSHKTDVGGVVVGISSPQQLEAEWTKLEKKLREAQLWDTLDAILVMQHIKSGGREFVAGIVDKDEYGHQMMFGIGGVFVEALKEVAFSPCPLTLRDANALINGTKAKNLLGEVRGKGAADLDVLRENLLRLSQLVSDFPRIKEVDANPFMLNQQGKLYAVDARIILDK